MEQNQEIIHLLRQKIEQQAEIRPETPGDFEELCEYIQNELKKKSRRKKGAPLTLGTKTLQRLWGREKYKGAFSMSTRSTLAKVAGYSYWGEAVADLEACKEKKSCRTEKKIPLLGLKARGFAALNVILLIINIFPILGIISSMSY